MKQSKKRSGMRSAIALVLVVVLSVMCVPGALAEVGGTKTKMAGEGAQAVSAAPAEYEKSEVVYAVLDAAGSMEAAYVVNRFDVTSAGAIDDSGAYDKVSALNKDVALTYDEGVTSFEVDEGAFFYQGDSAAMALPWNVSFAYELDGAAIAPDDLAGKSGRLAVHIRTSANDAVDQAFYESFMLQITLTLDGSSCRDIVAEGATIAAAGSDYTVAFTVLPGQDGDFTLEVQVEDFAMAGAQIAALPYSSVIEMPSTDGLESEMSQLTDAVSDLSGGADSLVEGSVGFADGAATYAAGVAQYCEGLSALSAGSEGLVSGSDEIAAGLAQLSQGLSAYVGGMAQAGMPVAPELQELAGGLTALSQKYGEFDAGLEQYAGGVDALAAQSGEIAGGAAQLAEGASSLSAGIREYAGGVSQLDAATSSLPEQMRSRIDDMMADYDFPEFVPVSFVSPENKSVTAVQFVMTTQPIELPEEPEAEEPAEEEETIFDRFLALFK